MKFTAYPSPKLMDAPGTLRTPARGLALHPRVLAYALTVAACLGLLALLPHLPWRGNEYRHTFYDSVATILALFVSIIALVRFYSKKNNTFLFIWIGFLCTALLDAYHALVAIDSLYAHISVSREALWPWSWLASRLFLSLFLWLSWWTWRKEARLGEAARVNERRIYWKALAATGVILLLFSVVALPSVYQTESGVFRPAELVPGLFFLLALLGYLHKGHWQSNAFEHWLILALIIHVFAQVGLMAFSRHFFDIYFESAHILKCLAYGLVLVGLLLDMFHLFRQVDISSRKLEEMNWTLQKEITDRKRAQEKYQGLSHSLEQQVQERTQELRLSRTAALNMLQDIEETRQKTEAINRQLSQEIAIRKRIEESLKRQAGELEQVNAELDKANRELKDFAYIASHDLKAPLRAIASLASWIQEDAGDRLGGDCQEHLALLINRVDRMNGLIDGILQYSRIGRSREQIRQTDLNQLVPGVIDILAPPESIRVHIDTPLPVLYIEETRIEQVFLNLIGNAIKYMDKTPGDIRVGCAEEDDRWLFWVKDNGPGIDKRYFERIFQIFQTLAPRDQIESTGIGLTIVKKIVEMYGGQVWLESEVGQGATFYFSLMKTINTELQEEYK